MYTITDSSKTIDFDDFTEGTTPSTSNSKTSSVKKFNVTSTVANTTITTHIPESHFSTLQSNKHVIPFPKDNYAVKKLCFEKICNITLPKNLGKKNIFFFFKSNLYLLFFFNF